MDYLWLGGLTLTHYQLRRGQNTVLKDGNSCWNHTRYGYGNETYYIIFLLHSADDGDGLRVYHHSYPKFENHQYYTIGGDGLTAYHLEFGNNHYYSTIFICYRRGEYRMHYCYIYEMPPQAMVAHVTVGFCTIPDTLPQALITHIAMIITVCGNISSSACHRH